MKKILFYCAALALLSSCNSKPEDPTTATRDVTFKIDAFHVQTAAMAPRKAPILDDTDGQALTDLFIFDGTTQLAHQTSDLETFGEVTLTMTYGTHNLSFVATRSTSINFDEGVLAMTSIRPTFGKLQTITVSDATDAFDITIQRITGQLIITIEDAIPADADHITFNIAEKYDDLNVTTFAGVDAYAFEQTASLTSSVGQSGKTYTLNMLSPTYGDQYTTDVTLSVYRSDNTLVAQHLIQNVPIATNTKTLLTGKMFSGQAFTVTADVTWEDPINGVW